jgi:predicted CoA-binding protein
MTVVQQVEDFLAQKRIAIVGVSRTANDFTRGLFNEFVKRGYDVVPVNPNATEIDGHACFASVRDINPPVGSVLVLTPAAAAAQVVKDCGEAGVKQLWLHKGEGIGAVSDEALALAKQYGMNVVNGFCPFMFLPNSSFFHRIHRFFRMRSKEAAA